MTTPKIACPSCHSYDSKVINVRPLTSGGGVYRRRECLSCHERFSTKETLMYTSKTGKSSAHRNI